MAQCPGDTGKTRKFELIPLGQKLTESIYLLVTAMAMVEVGSPETTWTVQVVDHIETRMMVTVRYVFISVVAKEDNCGNKKSYEITNQTTAITAVSSQDTLQFSAPAQKEIFVRQPAALTPHPVLNSWKIPCSQILIHWLSAEKMKLHQHNRSLFFQCTLKTILWQRHLTQKCLPESLKRYGIL